MPLNEADTRVQLIDQQLAEAGWDVSNPRQVVQELALRYPGKAEAKMAASAST